jgi:ceramide glucosyltransferase
VSEQAIIKGILLTERRMGLWLVRYVLLGIAAIPFIYYLIALFSSWRFFRQGAKQSRSDSSFTPPLSILKPVRGLDPDAYQNFASFCRQDYPEYEIVFCVGDESDPVMDVIDQIIHDFPHCKIRVLLGSGRVATNDKVAKLARLTEDAQYEVLVINDSDVRAEPNYLRTIVAPLEDPKVGAVTCMYVPTDETTLVQHLQSVGMMSDFYAGILVAWKLEGIKFALGPTIATTRARLLGFGGYQAIENRPADDLLVGRLIADQGFEVKLLPYAILTVADFQSLRDLVLKRLRWIVVMRHMRPWGHLGLIFTFGLPWSIAAIAIKPTAALAASFLGVYFSLRAATTWLIGGWGLKQAIPLKKYLLIPLWDALAFGIWLTSFTRSTIMWRNREYRIKNGELSPVEAQPAAEEARPVSVGPSPLEKKQ